MADLVARDRLTLDSSDAPPAVVVHGDGGTRPAAATVEHLLYALIFLAGLGARLLMLGASPFATHEAAAAWAAWMDATAMHPTAAPAATSALLHALQTLTFWITGGGNETLARLPVALLSSLIPLLPWFWRDRLSRPAALILAALLAFDPWLIAFGRMADATALSAALALCALTALHVATRALPEDPEARNERSVAATVSAVATGLLLASGPQAWSWLIVLALYVLIAAEQRQPVLTLRNGVVGLVAALLGATGWLAWPQEFAMVGASLTEWLGAFVAGPYNALWPAIRTLVDQPFVLIFGLLGLALLWSRPAADRGARLFLTLWLGWALLLILLPGRVPGMLPLLGLPLAICAALALQWLLALGRTTTEWSEGALLALVLIAALLALLFWSAQMVATSVSGTSSAVGAPLMLGVVVLLLAAYAWFVSARQALVVGTGVIALFLFAATLSAARQLAFAGDPSHPNGLFQTVAWPEAATLRADVRALSERRTGDTNELPVQVVTGPTQAADPLVGWLLRDMANISFVTSPRINPGDDPARAPLIVTPPGGDQTAWDSAYIGSTYRLQSAWLPSDLPPLTGHESGEQRWNAGWRPRLRWLIYRAAPTQPAPEAVNLWATPQ